MTLIRYACGHVGRKSSSPAAKAEAFIRVAEIRDNTVTLSVNKCPDCGNRNL